MIIIIAPAKKMKNDISFINAKSKPQFLKETNTLMCYMKTLRPQQLKKVLQCSDSIANKAYEQYQTMQLDKQVVPALLAFEGIQYTYMAPYLFEDEWFVYAQKHIRILSGFYGILAPFDGVVPYRLEINNSFSTPFCRNLYDFWKDKLYQSIVQDDSFILDLASAQHSRIIKSYISSDIQYAKCYFMEQVAGKRSEKGVYVKMARGAMVRYLTQYQIQDIEGVKKFQELGYHYRDDLSDQEHIIFCREKKIHGK